MVAPGVEMAKPFGPGASSATSSRSTVTPAASAAAVWQATSRRGLMWPPPASWKPMVPGSKRKNGKRAASSSLSSRSEGIAWVFRTFATAVISALSAGPVIIAPVRVKKGMPPAASIPA